MNTIDKITTNIKTINRLGYLIILGIFMIAISYYISEGYRVGKVLHNMSIYNGYMSVTNTPFESKNKNGPKYNRLCDYYIASSFRPLSCTNQLFDYMSLSILQTVLKYGPRFIWVDVFNSELSDKAEPIISNGIKDGNWKLSLNVVSFKEFCYSLSQTIFKSGKVNNYEDPFILSLNLNTQHNLHCLKKIKDYLLKYLGPHLLGVHYNYKNINIGNVTMDNLCGGDGRIPKLIIFANGEFENSDLDELINYSWSQDNLKLLNYKSISPNISDADVVKEDIDYIKNYNTTNLSIVTPDRFTLLTRQYNPEYAFNSGCQFICMYYQSIDKFIEAYVKKFNKYSFVLKPPELRNTDFKEVDITKLQTQMDASQKGSLFSKCPLEPDGKDI
jgi:hypothetical protein